MLHRPRRSVVYRSGKDDETDRKTYRDRSIDCVAILNEKGWYEARNAPVDCLDMVEHSMKSYSVLTEDKWYGESFDNVCGEILMPNGSKRSFKGYMAVGVDQDHRVVCVPPGAIPDDAPLRIIRYAILHTTLFKKHAGKKRAETLSSYAAKAMEAKTPREFLSVVKDAALDLGKAIKRMIGKVISLKSMAMLLISFMVIFVITAHAVDVQSLHDGKKMTSNRLQDVQQELQKRLADIKAVGKHTVGTAQKQGWTWNWWKGLADMKYVEKYTNTSIGDMKDEIKRAVTETEGPEFFKEHRQALFDKFIPESLFKLDKYEKSARQLKVRELESSLKTLKDNYRKLDSKVDEFYHLKFPAWLVELAQAFGDTTRAAKKSAGDTIDHIVNEKGFGGSITAMSEWFSETFPRSTALKEVISETISQAISSMGWGLMNMIQRTTTYEDTNANIENVTLKEAAKQAAQMAKDKLSKG